MQAAAYRTLVALLLTTLLVPPFQGAAASTLEYRSTHMRVVQPVAKQHDDSSEAEPAPSDQRAAGLYVVPSSGIAVRDFPIKHTSVDAQVVGTNAHVVVRQTFQNPYDEPIEAQYVFPLPHRGAIHDFWMEVGKRRIQGLVQRREEAAATYDAAKEAGQVAVLMEQEHPNVFVQSVANISPGHEIVVEMTYVADVLLESGEHEFVFPMVISPYYMGKQRSRSDSVAAPQPAVARQTPDHALHPTSLSELAQLPVPEVISETSRLNPDYLPPTVRSSHDIDLQVEIDAGVRIGDVSSLTHVIERTDLGSSRAMVRLHRLDTIPNRDFVLRWSVDSESVEAAVSTSHDGEDGYVSVVLHPKTDFAPVDRAASELVFVIDRSGSMRGTPIALAKEVTLRALRHLRPQDTFRIFHFANDTHTLVAEALDTTPENVKHATTYVNQIAAGGGTQMLPAIEAALAAPADPKRLRMIVLLTDASVGDTGTVLAELRDNIGEARVFALGFSSSVNRYFLEELAREGRGDAFFVTPADDLRKAVAAFLDRIRSPYLTDLELDWGDLEIEDVSPRRVPDLFANRPLVVRARYGTGGRGNFVIRGKLGGQKWERLIRLDLPTRESGNPAVGIQWARSRVADLMRVSHSGEAAEIQEEIVQLGLRHKLVTQYTSFVAVDEYTIVSRGKPKTVRVPVELPESKDWTGHFGSHSRVRQPTLGTDHFVRGGRSPNAKTVIDGLPTRDVLKGANFPILEPIRVSATKLDELKKEQSASVRIVERSAPSFLEPGHESPTRASFATPPEQSGTIRPFNGRVRAINNPITEQDLAHGKIELQLSRTTVSLADEVELTIVVTNASMVPLPVPTRDALTLEYLGLRRVDENGRSRVLGDPLTKIDTEMLAPGKEQIYRLTVRVEDLVQDLERGDLQIFLDGTRWSAAQSKAHLLRIDDSES